MIFWCGIAVSVLVVVGLSYFFRKDLGVAGVFISLIPGGLVLGLIALLGYGLASITEEQSAPTETKTLTSVDVYSFGSLSEALSHNGFSAYGKKVGYSTRASDDLIESRTVTSGEETKVYATDDAAKVVERVSYKYAPLLWPWKIEHRSTDFYLPEEALNKDEFVASASAE